MKAIIIEDEQRAATHLRRLTHEIDPTIEIIAELQTIDQSVAWFHSHPMPDLVFLDIHLADGSSFEIFKEAYIECPIIFTTAYDEYALKAFEVNSIDYLLKPINEENLRRALMKTKTLARHPDNTQLMETLLESLQHRPIYKSALLVTHKDRLIPIAVKDIAYIGIEDKSLKFTTFNGKKYSVNNTLEKLSQELQPRDFFRVNRQQIVSRAAIKDASVWFSGQLVLNLTVPVKERMLVSRSNVKDFKEWLTE